MEKSDFDTDIDDDETGMEEIFLPRLSFEQKISVHRENRLPEIFGSIKSKKKDLRIPSRCKTPSDNHLERLRKYEKSCHRLDLTMDWQLRALLAGDHITVFNRSFSFNDIRAFTSAIEANLKSLTLSSVGLSSRSIENLCQRLIKCVHLNLLDLSYNKITKQSFELLAEVVNHLPSLLYLSFAECGIRDSSSRQVGELCRHRRIRELNLSGNELEETSCILIGSALTENQHLVYLNLSWNFIRSYASIAVFRGFEMNKTLTEFDVSWSGLGYDGSVAIRRVLMVNRALQRLNISSCNIDWSSAKLLSEGLARNCTLTMLNLSFNPLTTHGIHLIVEALSTKKNAVSLLDLSGMTVYSATVRLAEKIAKRREFIMKYDFEIPVHDIIGQEQTTESMSVGKMVQQLGGRNWRALDIFRMLESKKKLQAQNEIVPRKSKYNNEYGSKTIENLQHHLFNRSTQSLTYKDLTSMMNHRRMRERWQKARSVKQEQDIQKRNEKILQAVTQHFPNIDIISKQEKQKRVLAQLSKPRMFPPNDKK